MAKLGAFVRYCTVILKINAKPPDYTQLLQYDKSGSKGVVLQSALQKILLKTQAENSNDARS